MAIPHPTPTEHPVEEGRVAVFADAAEAVAAARALLDAGLPADRLGFVGEDAGAMEAALGALDFAVKPVHERPEHIAEAVGHTGADLLLGAAIGATAGLVVGLGPFLIPIFGPMLLAEATAEILGGAALSAAMGSGVGAVMGGLFERDVEQRHLERWRAALRTGGWLLVARGDAGQMRRADEVLATTAAEHVDMMRP